MFHVHGRLPGPPWVSLGVLQVLQALAIWRIGLSQGWRVFSLPGEGLIQGEGGGGHGLSLYPTD